MLTDARIIFAADDGPRWTRAPDKIRTVARAGMTVATGTADVWAIAARARWINIMTSGVGPARAMVNSAFTTVPQRDISKAVAPAGPTC